MLHALFAGVRRCLQQVFCRSWRSDGFLVMACDGSRLECPRSKALEKALKPCSKTDSAPMLMVSALVLRTDVANVYGTALPRALFSRMIEQPVEQALRLDASCVVEGCASAKPNSRKRSCTAMKRHASFQLRSIWQNNGSYRFM